MFLYWVFRGRCGIEGANLMKNVAMLVAMRQELTTFQRRSIWIGPLLGRESDEVPDVGFGERAVRNRVMGRPPPL